MGNEDQELKIKVTLQGDTAGGTEVEQSLKKVTAATGETGKSALEGARSTRELGTEVKHLGQLGHEVERVMEGLARGGLGGLAESGKAAGQIIRTLASGALGAVLVPAVAAATIGLLLMKKAAEANEEAIKKAFENNAKAGEAYATSLEALKKASEKRLAEIGKGVDQVIAKYKELTELIDAAAKRQEKLGGAKADLQKATTDTAEKKALLGAATPDEAARIKSDFALRRQKEEGQETVAGFQNKELAAGVRSDVAKDALAELENQKRKITATLDRGDRDASFKKENIVNGGLDIRGDIDTSQRVVESRRQALAARDAAKDAREKAQPELQKVAGAIREQEAIINAAKVEVEETSLRRQAYQKIIEGKAADNQLKEKTERTDAAKKQAAQATTEAGVAGEIAAVKDADFKSLDLKHTDTSALEAKLGEIHSSQASTYKAIAEHAQATVKEDHLLKDQLRNSREGGGT